VKLSARRKNSKSVKITPSFGQEGW